MTLRTFSSTLRRPVHAIAFALSLAGTAPAFAAPSPADGTSPDASPAWIHPLVGMVLTGGAGKSSVTNPDGNTASGSLAGRYEALAGAEFPIDPNGLTLRLTLGIHASASFSSTGGGGEHFTRFPLEATLWYPVGDKLRVGAGARYAAHPRFSGAGDKTSDGLNSTPAPLVAVDYRLLSHLSLDMRYVYERYEQASGGDLEGSHFGIGMTAIY
jgi:hypothetical protein